MHAKEPAPATLLHIKICYWSLSAATIASTFDFIIVKLSMIWWFSHGRNGSRSRDSPILVVALVEENLTDIMVTMIRTGCQEAKVLGAVESDEGEIRKKETK